MGSVHGWVGKPGSAPLMVQRQEFAVLIARGVSNAEACRLVGVNRRTGTRWRFGCTITSSSGMEVHYPAMATMKTTCMSARFLSEDERVLIGDRVRAGASLRAIGRELGRPVSTVSREVRRNRDEAGRYRPFTAHQMAARRLVRPKERRLARDPVLRDKVQGWLGQRWSPNRSPTLCGWSTRRIRPGTWSTRASTRQSTTRTGPWDGTASPVCAPDDAAAGHTESRTRDALGTCGR